MDEVDPSMTRRGLLAGIGGGATSALAGCADRFWSEAESTGPEQVSLSVKTVPTDDDRLATMITSQLVENYQQAGIDASRETLSKSELYRDILLESEYDVFVARHPGFDEPDGLYGLLHSRFVSEPGWQNPFHFSDVAADDYLERQRRMDEDDRQDVLMDLIGHLLETTPYTVVASPYTICGADQELTVPNPPDRPCEYFELLSHPENGPRDGPLEIGAAGEHLIEQLNPLTVDRNRIDGVLDLLYDPLARRIDGEYVPWLAESIEWTDGEPLEAEITLRDGTTWHDGEPLDADDVEFTLDFLADTSMGDVDGGVPASRFRGRQTLVTTSSVSDDRTIRFSFEDTTPSAARRVLSVPLLPAHVWSGRSEVVADRQTQAMVDENDEPIGSGLFAFADATSNQELLLTPFEDHVLRHTANGPDVLEGFSQYEGLRFRIDPNPASMVDTLINGETDVTSSRLPPNEMGTIHDASNVSAITGTTDAFYMIGYNSQHDELGNPHFRRICSRLLDREFVVSEFFESLAQVPTTPNELVGIHDQDWEYDDEFDQASDPLSFLGSDGDVNTNRAQSQFTGIGYSYDGTALLK